MKSFFYLLLTAAVITVGCQAGADKGGDAPKEDAKIESKTEAKKEAAKPAPAPKVAGNDQAKIDDDIIQKYLKDNNLEAQKTASGLYYIVEKEGTGEIKPNYDVNVHYEGTLLDGSKFDSSYDRGKPAHFGLRRVIPGWTEGIPLFKNGGKGILLIPSKLAYGPRGAGAKIPPNSVLKFKVEVLGSHDPASHGHSH